MINPIDLHLRLDIAYSQLNSNKKLDVLPEVKDRILNDAVSEFINNILTPIKNPERLGFESTEVIYTKLQRLVADKKETVFFGITDGAGGYTFDNEVNRLPYPIDNLKELYYGYTFKPYNQLEFIKGTINYKGTSCTNVSTLRNTFTTQSELYTIIPLSSIGAGQYLYYTSGGGGVYNLIDPTLNYLPFYTSEYKFQLIYHIINKLINVYELGSPFRLEIGYEYLDGIYARDSIIVKDNTTKYLPTLNYGIISRATIGTQQVPSVGLQSYPFTFKTYTKAIKGSTDNDISKIGLYSNKSIIDISDNYYYQKNKIKEVPVALRNNVYMISNLLPHYIPLSITYNYIRKPIIIDYQLNQGLELSEDVETIIAIASRLMTAYTSNPNAYQISNNEQLKQ